ncbi:hypothetical protein ACA910_004989 [Epithemia clementina (nom. ined.)]
MMVRDDDGSSKLLPSSSSRAQHDADKELSKSSSPSDAAKTASVWGGTTRGTLYSLQKLGISSTILYTFVKKKSFLLLGQQPIQSSYPSPVDQHWKEAHRIQWRTTYAGRAAEFVKGSVLGMAVFGVYDYLILRRTAALVDKGMADPTASNQVLLRLFKTNKDIATRHPNTHALRLDSMVSWHLDHQLPLYMHLQAGALAGLIQSFVLDAWEIGEYLVLHRTSTTSSQLYHNLIETNVELILRRGLHHAIGFATLFGSYEAIRFSMAQSTWYSLASNPQPLLDSLNKWGSSKTTSEAHGRITTSYDITFLPITITFIAGGLAGQAYFIATHYLRQWKIGTLAAKAYKKHHAAKWKHIHWRPFAATFVPTGISFIAFQYAGELSEYWMPSDMERTARTQLFV